MQLLRKFKLAAVLAFVFVSSAYAQVVTVVTEEYPPYNFQDPSSKKITGMGTEVVEEVLKRAKVDFKLDIFPWARAYQMAQEAPNVLIYSIGRNEKREALFKWVGVIAPYDVYLYKLKSRADVNAANVADVKKFKVGAVRDDVRAQYLEKAGVAVDLVTSDALNTKKLASSRIDMFPIDELGLVALYKREGIDPATVVKVIKLDELSAGLNMAFSQKTDDAIVKKVQAALEQVKSDGTFEKIRQKYVN
jgi:polar amino acid transport system substrate-binding protein